MPKRRIIRRRNKAVKRKTVSSSSLKSHDQQLNENDLPPHLLDKIPSSMSLRPTPQTLRSMLMQRLAPSYIQMPTMSPQQQQVQNLKNNNDIKEQAINQTKQDMINENERKRTLTRKEAEQKREQTKMKNEIENERQELKQQQDYERTMNELNIKKRQLEYEKMMNEHDAEALKKKNEIETQKALIEQMKYENQRMRNEIDNNDYSNKINTLNKELKDLTTENTALANAIEKLNSGDQLNQITELAQELTLNKARNMLIKKLNDENNRLLENELENMVSVKDEDLRNQMTTMKDEITKQQTAIVKQLNDKKAKERDIKKHDFYQNMLDEKNIENERLNIENDRLQKQLGSYNEQKNKDEVNKLVKKNVEQEMNGRYLKERIELQDKISKGQNEISLNNERIKYMNSKEFQDKIKEIEANKQTEAQLNLLSKTTNEAVDAYNKVIRSRAKEEIGAVVHEAVKNGYDPVEALCNKLGTASEEATRVLALSRENEIYNQMVAQSTTAHQESQEKITLINHYRGINGSTGTEKALFDQFVSEKVNGDFESVIANADLATMKDFDQQFQSFKTEHMSEMH